MNAPGESTVQVRGYSAFNVEASLAVRILARALDMSLATAVFCAVHPYLQLDLKASLAALGFTLAGAWFLAAPQRWLWKGTLGQLAWGLRVERQGDRSTLASLDDRVSRRRKVFRTGQGSIAVFVRGMILTGFAGTITMASAQLALERNPVLRSARPWTLAAFVPAPEAAKDWWVAPYFYALGAWPSHFAGRPVLYGLPYQKGPPERFIGNIVARWELPDVQVTFEGPKTPVENLTPAALRGCLTSLLAAVNEPECLRIREQSLARHIQGIRQSIPELSERSWVVKWFQIDNPYLGAEERPQGIYLRAGSESRTQERFVFITARGTHQAFILERPNTKQGEAAQALFEQAIRSQRISDGLAPGREWINRKLASQGPVLQEKIADPQSRVAHLTELQALLLAKISVDPRGFDAYFQLAGTTSLLSKKALELKNSEWTAAAKPLIQSLSRYAKDIAPSDERTEQMEKLWQDLRNR